MKTSELTSHDLPPELQELLTRFQKRWRWVNSMALVGMLLCIPLTSFLLLAFSDRLWATPGWIRLIVAVPVPVLLFVALYPWAKRWLIERPNSRRLAHFMGQLDPQVCDRVLGAVELAEGSEENWVGSHELRRAAIEQVAQQMKGVKPEQRLETGGMKRLIGGAAVLTAMVVFFFALAPRAVMNSFARWRQPHKEIERFTFVRLFDFPETLHVAHGEAFDFQGRVAHVQGRAIPDVTYRVDGTESLDVHLEPRQGVVTVEAEGMMDTRDVHLKSGDAQERIRIEPMMRPELHALAAELEWPEYLKKEPENLSVRRRRVEVPIGSRVALNGTVSRDLTLAQLGNGQKVNVEGSRFLLPAMLVESNLSFTVSWEDTVGLSPLQPATVEVIATEDRAPQVALSGLATTVAMLPDQFVEIELRARDDYGLDRVWASWRAESEQGLKEREREARLQGKTGQQTLSFSPERMGFAVGDTIELAAFAVDALPGREPSRSSRHRIFVIGKEQHAKMLMTQMEDILAALDDEIREESITMEENKDLEGDSPEDILERALDELARAERVMDTAENMDDLIREAGKNDQITDKQIGDWAEISSNLKEKAVPAMESAARKMKNAAEAMAHTDGGSSMPSGDSDEDGEGANAGQPGEESDNGSDEDTGDSEALADTGEPGEPGKNGEAGSQSPSGQPGQPGQSGQPGSPMEMAGSEQEPTETSDMEVGIREDHEEAINAMKHSEEALNESINQSLSASFINRFKELARLQGEVGDTMTTLLPLTIGKTAEELPEELSTQIRDNAKKQEHIATETRYVFDDLEGYYRRSQEEVLQVIRTEMSEEDFMGRLPKMQEMIAQNIIGQTTQEATAWKQNFLSWADRLSDDAGGGGGSGGAGAGGGDEEGESLETMIALLRAREQQENLRRHTRALNESYAENLNFDQDAADLADRQNELGKALLPLEQRVVTPETKHLVSVASGEMMNAGLKLNASETDQGTIGIQTEVIEMLAQALDQSMSNQESSEPSPGNDPSTPQPGSSRAAMMQKLMQMMQASAASGQGSPGQQGGEGSTGSGDPGAHDLSGHGRLSSSEKDRKIKATGLPSEYWPHHFREMREKFYSAMEFDDF